MKKVSVIVPAYNVEKYIGRCLDSIQKQTYSEMEILVIDDGSTDGTWEIVKEYAKRDSRVIPVHRENGGVSKSRNEGLSLATGDYIAFLDADDYWNDDSVEIMVRKLEESSADWLNCQYRIIDEEGKEKPSFQFYTGRIPCGTSAEKVEFLVHIILMYRVGFEVWDKLYSGKIIREQGLRFNEKCSIGEDLAFNILYSLYVDSIVSIEEVCYNYLNRENSAMRTLDSLSRKMTECLTMLQGVQRDFEVKKDSILDENFYLIFSRLMDNTYRGYCGAEIVECLRNHPLKDYYRAQAAEISKHKKEITGLHPRDVRFLRWRIHIYIQEQLSGPSLGSRIFFLIYNFYRKLRGREPLEKWIML